MRRLMPGLLASAFLVPLVSRSADQPQFWLFHAAIALTAAFGGVAATFVATFLEVLLVRLSSPTPLSTALLFGLEGLFIGLVVLRMAKTIQDLRRRLDVSARSISELESAERQGSRIDHALSRLDRKSEDTVVLLLDPAGQISDWRAGAARMYGFTSSQIVGTGAAILFCGPGRMDFPRLLAEAQGDTNRGSYRQVRVDGTTFEAEIEISPVSHGLDGFTMIVHDLTRQQARAAADWSTTQAQAQLRGEMELAQRQLSALQDLTDPTLDSLGAVPFVTEILDRLRRAIHAEGIALIDVGRHPRRLFCASAGLQCQRADRLAAAVAATALSRAVMIHNDPAGVAEMSAAVWPDDVSSLIAVPVVRAGSATAVMEVVNRTGRRATEFEIALVQVVSARIAGFLRDGGPRVFSGSDLRLTLDQGPADHPGRDRIAS